MVTKIQLKAFFTSFATIMLFITFFSHYLLFSATLSEAFLRGVITYIVTSLIMNLLYILWRVSYPAQDWKQKIQTPPPIEFETEDEEINSDEMEALLSDL